MGNSHVLSNTFISGVPTCPLVSGSLSCVFYICFSGHGCFFRGRRFSGGIVGFFSFPGSGHLRVVTFGPRHFRRVSICTCGCTVGAFSRLFSSAGRNNILTMGRQLRGGLRYRRGPHLATSIILGGVGIVAEECTGHVSGHRGASWATTYILQFWFLRVVTFF